MTMQHSIEEFSENIRQDVLALAESDEQDMMLSDSFTQAMFDLLSEAGEFDDPLVCYHRARGMEVSGYMVDEDEARVDLFLSIHTNSTPPETVIRQRVEVAFRRLRSFLEWCLSGRHVELEESSPVFDMAAHIHAFRGSLAKVRLCVITDGRTTIESVPKDQDLGDIAISSSLWDVVRLHRLSTSGRQREDHLHRSDGAFRRARPVSSGGQHSGGVSRVPDAHSGRHSPLHLCRLRIATARIERQVISPGPWEGEPWNPGHRREGAGTVSGIQQWDHPDR